MSLEDLIRDISQPNPIIGPIVQLTAGTYKHEFPDRLVYDSFRYTESDSLVGITKVELIDGPSYNIATYEIFFSISQDYTQLLYDHGCCQVIKLIMGKSPSDLEFYDCKSRRVICNTVPKVPAVDPWCINCRFDFDEASYLFELLDDGPKGIFKFNDIPTSCVIDITKKVEPINWNREDHLLCKQKAIIESKGEMVRLMEKKANHEASLSDFMNTYDSKLQACYREAEKLHKSQFERETKKLNGDQVHDLERIEYIKNLETALLECSLKAKAKQDAILAEKNKIQIEMHKLTCKEHDLVLEKDKINKERATLAELLAKMS